ncbi:MAG TPA: MFS transporter [Candidatus Dormibacteraeota bacterium]|nr:MFS transporter [Candidatus Dormibacteraeota bacterium]
MTAGEVARAPGSLRFSVPRMVALSVYWLAINYLWQGMGALILPRLILARVDEAHRGVALALLSALGAAVAILVQPAAGALSDRCRVRWGRRKPFMVAGTLGDLVCLLGLALAGTYGALIIPYCALQICSNTAEGAYQGLLPDQIASADRGRASGYYGLAVFIGTAIGFLLTGTLIAIGRVQLALLSVGVVLVLALLVTQLFVPDSPAPGPLPGRRLALLGVFSFRPRENPDFTRLLASRLLALMGITGLTDFALLYIKATFYPGAGSAVANRAAGATSTLLAVVVLLAIVVTLPAARISQRVGRRLVIRFACWLGALGTLLLIFANSLVLVYAVGFLIGSAFGMLLSVDWAFVVDLVPADSAGRFMGISNLATAGSGILATVIAGPLLDFGNSLRPNAGFPMIFGFFAIALCLGGWLVWSVRTPGELGAPPAGTHDPGRN